MPACTMGSTFVVAIPADRRNRMDAIERQFAVEEHLRSQFLAALAGDAASYRQFLSALSAHLRAFLRRRMQRWPDDVEDLVQETLLAVHDHRHTYRPAEPLTAWVHTIARYKLIDYLRARSRREELNDPLDEELEIFARSDTEAAEARRDLARMLEQLPERQRRVLVMVKLAGASVAEASRETGQTEASVKVNVHRGLKALAARFRSGS
jgi:RNA polymerase sigma-70 factor, ECF subfamily